MRTMFGNKVERVVLEEQSSESEIGGTSPGLTSDLQPLEVSVSYKRQAPKRAWSECGAMGLRPPGDWLVHDEESRFQRCLKDGRASMERFSKPERVHWYIQLS